MKDRIGKFLISGSTMREEEFEVLSTVLNKLKFIPLSVSHIGYLDIYEYVGVSPLFDPIKSGNKIFEYSIEISQILGKEVDVSVKKVSCISIQYII